MGLGAERRLRLRQYSKGMVQRVGLAQALLNEPEVVFLDEPMSGLDPLGRRHVRQLMLRLRDRGCTVFFSSHILSDAESLCSRVAHPGAGPARRLGPPVGHSRVRAPRLGTGGGQPRRTSCARALPPRVPHRSRRWRTAATPSSCRPSTRPTPFLDELRRGGAQIVSLNPLRETLEDYFVQSVGAAAARETGL